VATWSAEEIAALRAAIASGVLTVSYSSNGQNRSVTYQSLDQMLELLAQMEATAEDAPRAKYRNAQWNRGTGRTRRGSFRRNE